MITVCFIADGRELRLPVTPMFSAPAGKKIETVNIDEVGDVNLPGKPTPATIQLEGFFPAADVPYAIGTGLDDPYDYVQQFASWAKSETVVRYVVTGTSINLPVLIESIDYGEEDGTGDVHYTLNLVEYVYLETPTTEIIDTGNGSRSETDGPGAPLKYTVKKGDTLAAIARKYYGDSSLAYKIATVNGIKNPSLIYPGQVLDLPDAKELEGVKPTKSRGVSNSTTQAPASYTKITSGLENAEKQRREQQEKRLTPKDWRDLPFAEVKKMIDENRFTGL